MCVSLCMMSGTSRMRQFPKKRSNDHEKSGPCADGQGKNHQTAAAVRVADIHLALVTGDDLITDCKTDARAAILG